MIPLKRRRPLSRYLLTLTIAASLTACSSAAAPEPSRAIVAPSLEAERAVMEDGYELPVVRWAPEGEIKAVALALHGFNDYRRAFATVGPELAEQGILTIAYDQRGFGNTEGRGHWAGTERMVRDARTMSALIRARHPDLPLYLVGESMGGAVTMTALPRPMRPRWTARCSSRPPCGAARPCRGISAPACGLRGTSRRTGGPRGVASAESRPTTAKCCARWAATR
jgi:predicted alpha/beta-fold hydrolase